MFALLHPVLSRQASKFSIPAKTAQLAARIKIKSTLTGRGDSLSIRRILGRESILKLAIAQTLMQKWGSGDRLGSTSIPIVGFKIKEASGVYFRPITHVTHFKIDPRLVSQRFSGSDSGYIEIKTPVGIKNRLLENL